TKHIEGNPTRQLLPAFKAIAESIQFGKNMRWGEESLRYVRPVRWLVGMYGNEIIPFELASVASGNITYGHRFLGNKITLQHPGDYAAALEKNYCIPDSAKREQLIKAGIHSLESKHECVIPIDRDLLVE